MPGHHPGMGGSSHSSSAGPAGGASSGGNYGGNTHGGGGGGNGGGGPPTRHSPHTDSGTVVASKTKAQRGLISSDDEYDEPDRDHYNQTQKEIAQRNRELARSGQYDTSMTKEEYDQFNEDLNKYYGTENVKYEPYGRAGKGTVNLSFKEHWDNIGQQSPALKFSPTLRFLAAAGRNIGEFLTTDYGTYKYAGKDSGGLLGSIGLSGNTLTQAQINSDAMKAIAPEAPYIVSGITKPTNSPAANWYQSLGQTNTSGFTFSFANELAAAKAKQASILGNPSPIGQLAVSNSPFYNWLKERSLDKGIL